MQLAANFILFHRSNVVFVRGGGFSI